MKIKKKKQLCIFCLKFFFYLSQYVELGIPIAAQCIPVRFQLAERVIKPQCMYKSKD